MSDAHYLAGRILLALPGMFDPRFARAVIAMCVHDENGALGIGVGTHHAELRFHDVLQDAGIDVGLAPDVPVHIGGPVEPQRGFVLHSPDWAGSATIAVNHQFALSYSPVVLQAIAAGEGPSHWLFALGYAGWGAGQLDNELRYHGWHAAGGREEILFETPADQRWAATWKAEGIDPALLAHETGRA